MRTRPTAGEFSGPVFAAESPRQPVTVIRDLQVGRTLILYARMNLSGEEKADASLRRSEQERLTEMLWARSATASHGTTHDVRIVRTRLGRPLLTVRDRRCGSVSFSWTTGVLWGALVERDMGVGIDAAEASEFEGAYPYERVFSGPEWEAWFAGGRENGAETAALVWSGKEAVVKAVGCGFHLIAPREVEIIRGGPRQERMALRAGFSDRVLQRFPELRGAQTSIVSFKQDRTWVSIALIEGHSGGIGG